MITARERQVAEPPWLRNLEVSDIDRVLEMVYFVVRRTGRSPAAAARLCVRLVPKLAASATAAPSSPSHRLAAARRARIAVATTLRGLEHRRDPAVFDTALAEAVVRDELALLPPRQRFTVWSVAVRHRPISEVAAEAGWTRSQVVRLLNAGLSTITRWGTHSIPFV
ncbi:hypothetical protein Amsp01_043780 [Amycolatopsis sp. NBRC 101858]|uniref:hypothetical protein n=1 Tax=Amycolatopsis sp. NBRC 101858 TaxID=3032200 RepID=UPI0024A0FC21|nr:hypothetical protein [Amycolatopsis sp. NBRC 101858]GLY38354.1 hypothetical protein Amsp01_043780 [Amycolatopsis sp. NBRC 101858]